MNGKRTPDPALLLYAARYGAFPACALSVRFPELLDRDLQVAALCAARLLSAVSPRPGLNLFVVTARGLRASGLSLAAPAAGAPLAHLGAVALVGGWLERLGVGQVLCDRELSKAALRRDRWLALGPLGGRKLPDLLVVGGGEPIACEVELTLKSRERLAHAFALWKGYGDGPVLYAVPPHLAAPLRRLAGSAPVAVLAVPGLAAFADADGIGGGERTGTAQRAASGKAPWPLHRGWRGAGAGAAPRPSVEPTAR